MFGSPIILDTSITDHFTRLVQIVLSNTNHVYYFDNICIYKTNVYSCITKLQNVTAKTKSNFYRKRILGYC